jgi:hypothetical protein
MAKNNAPSTNYFPLQGDIMPDDQGQQLKNQGESLSILDWLWS